MNALRLQQGFDTGLLSQRTGIAFNTLEKGLQAAQQQGLLELQHDQLKTSQRGQFFLNEILELFL